MPKIAPRPIIVKDPQVRGLPVRENAPRHGTPCTNRAARQAYAPRIHPAGGKCQQNADRATRPHGPALIHTTHNPAVICTVQAGM